MQNLPQPVWRQSRVPKEDQPLFTYVIGDIHGCFDELLQLESKAHSHAAKHAARPFFVSVGDLIDRGPGSIAVVEHFYRGVNNSTHALVAGNHEQNYLQSLLAAQAEIFVQRNFPCPVFTQPSLNPYHRPLKTIDPDLAIQRRRAWLEHGGASVVAELGGGEEPDERWFMPDHLMQFLCRLPLCWYSEKLLVTHALIDRTHAQMLINQADSSLKNLDGEQYKKLLRLCLWSRDLPAVAPDSMRAHVSGHTPLHEAQYRPDLNLLRIDTSCVYGYKLTAWCADTGDLLSVPSSIPCRD